MKKIVGLTLAICMTCCLAACENKETKTTNTTIDFNASESTKGSLINKVEPVTVNEARINMDIEKPEITPVEPVKVKEASFDFEVSDFELNLSQNVTEAEAAKISGLDAEQKKIILEKKEALLTDMAKILISNNIDVMIDNTSGEIMLDSSILFANDESKVSQQGIDFLKAFVPAYASVICDDKYSDFIGAVLVEGHTDTNGTHDYNQKLSENRAKNVLDICTSDDIDISVEAKDMLKKLSKSAGCSFDRPVTDAAGNVDMDASRRVTFRFMINID